MDLTIPLDLQMMTLGFVLASTWFAAYLALC